MPLSNLIRDTTLDDDVRSHVPIGVGCQSGLLRLDLEVVNQALTSILTAKSPSPKCSTRSRSMTVWAGKET
jgi:hypothetical protein